MTWKVEKVSINISRKKTKIDDDVKETCQTSKYVCVISATFKPLYECKFLTGFFSIELLGLLKVAQERLPTSI